MPQKDNAIAKSIASSFVSPLPLKKCLAAKHRTELNAAGSMVARAERTAKANGRQNCKIHVHMTAC